MDLAGYKVDAGQQADRAEALIFVIEGEGRMHAGLKLRSLNKYMVQAFGSCRTYPSFSDGSRRSERCANLSYAKVAHATIKARTIAGPGLPISMDGGNISPGRPVIQWMWLKC